MQIIFLNYALFKITNFCENYSNEIHACFFHMFVYINLNPENLIHSIV